MSKIPLIFVKGLNQNLSQILPRTNLKLILP